MKLSSLSEINKKQVALHYRNEYTAKALFQTIDGRTTEKMIEFIVERTPTGKKHIQIRFVDAPDYPLLPLFKSLKEEIHSLDSKGLLL